MIDVTLDVSPVVHRKAGLATYTRSLGTALLAARQPDMALRAFSYGTSDNRALVAPLDSLPLTTVPWHARRWRLTVALRTLMRWHMDARVGIRPDRADVMHSKQHVFHATEHLLPPLAHCGGVFTFHDAIYALFPQFHLKLNLWFLNLMMPRFLARADSIIAVSACSKRDCINLYGIRESKIRVISEAADPRWQPVTDPTVLTAVRDKYKLPERFILYLGTIEPRKNLGAVFEALQRLRADPANQLGPKPMLVVAGRKGWLYEPLFAKVTELGLQDCVIFTGYVPDEDTSALMSAATLFVFASLYEGFGLPVLEAMACGTPVVCSNTSSLPEVAGDAALIVDPTDVRAFGGALRSLWDNPELRAQLGARGLRHVRQFSWERAAEETAAVYREVGR